jgi:hypothetical protein
VFPTEDAIVDAYALVRVRFSLGQAFSRPAIRVALRDAEHLAEDVFESPAALLFAFARTPRSFAGFRTMTVLLALDQVRASGQRLLAGVGVQKLAEVVEGVVRREMVYDDVRTVFADALFPFGG